MYRQTAPLVMVLGFLQSASAAPKTEAVTPAQAEFFETKVRPVLAEQCYACHAADKQRGGLRLDSRAAQLQGGDSGPAINPGDPDASRLVQAIRYQNDLHMPPRAKLADSQIAALTEWVKQGAPWPESPTAARPAAVAGTMTITDKDRSFWAFRPVRPPVIPPASPGNGGSETPIDRFLLAEMRNKGLHPLPVADRRTLLRRVTFDLIGLPPTPEEMEAFLRDTRPDAFARVVDRLLASPHYGERWARHWLDVARYGEDQAHTFQARKYPSGFRYRDWVIRAFNDDMPYDRFVMEQIAGDLVDGPEPREQRLAALGYFALGPVYYGKAVFDELDDRVDTLTRGFLGLTVACARCHDHKFDPVPQRDYYSLAGIFASTEYKEVPLTPDGRIDPTPPPPPQDKDKNKKKNEPVRPVLHSLADAARPSNMRVHLRGNSANLGEEAPRQFLSILSPAAPLPFKQGSGRLELAKAVASTENPLTARVMVNRIWMHHFGRGIVGTPSNFGTLGERPTHPELLDYLAARFMHSGWSIKTIHREILLSAAYQRGSQTDETNARIDPDNHYLWRMNRRRLEVEPWRDAMLAVAGKLDGTVGGPSVDLARADNHRRTLYGVVSRHDLDPVLRLFDFPDPNLTNDRRAVSIVPLQQLFVMNSEFMTGQARALATRITDGPEPDDAARILRAFEIVFGRPPTGREVELGTRYLAATGSPADGQRSSRAAWEKYAQVLLSSNEFAFVD